MPGLPAKPIIDMLLVVADSADEAAYVPSMEAAGYAVRIREPDWHEHRVFRGPDTDVNLHTFSAGSSEIERMLAFRDRLRTHDDERELYLATKRELAARHWTYVQDYADAKGEVVEGIIARAVAATVAPRPYTVVAEDRAREDDMRGDRFWRLIVGVSVALVRPAQGRHPRSQRPAGMPDHLPGPLRGPRRRRRRRRRPAGHRGTTSAGRGDRG